MVKSSGGYPCSSCNDKWASISYTCAPQDEYLWSARFTPTQSTIDIAFDYRFSYYDGGDYFYVYLYNETSGGTITLLNISSDANTSYSASKSVTIGDNYRIQFRYIGYCDDGATVDNVIVTEEVSYTGTDITDLTINNSGGNIILDDEISVD